MVIAPKQSATTMNNVNDLISLRDAAARLGVHVTTLRAWVRTGRLPAYRVGERFVRVSWRELLDTIASSGQPRAEPPSSTPDQAAASGETPGGA
jgi:excisionase family DNA binding protein